MKIIKELIILGAGDGAKELLFYIERINSLTEQYKVVEILDDNKSLHGTRVRGVEVTGLINSVKEKDDRFFYINAIHSPKIRKKITDEFYKHDLRYVNVIDPSATIDYETVELGVGNIIGPNTSILPNAIIKNFVIIDYGSRIAHDCFLDNYVTVSPQVSLAGHVKISEGVNLGIGSTFIQNLEIGKWSIIGAGAVVVRNIPEKVVAYGIPAKPMSPIDQYD